MTTPGTAGDTLRATIERALGAQYDVLRLIGRGGMGAVYLARERLLDRLVAVKVLPHEAATEQLGRERFLREARTAARLSHPNIVPLYSFAEAEGTFLYVMGYVDGEPLESRLSREPRLPPDEARRILAEVADALHYAHEQGVVHRDVKPDNILIETGTGRSILTDFGIAKLGVGGHTLTQTGVIVGTPHYMSPEQASGDRDIDGRSDIYALGVIGYRMLSGRLPFEGASLQEALTAHLVRDPVPLGSNGEAAALNAAVMRCLKKDPNERWPTARALSQSLAPREDEAIELPDELVELPASGTKTLFAILGLDVGIAILNAYEPDVNSLGPLAVFTLGVPAFVLGLSILKGAKHGLEWRRVLQIAFWPPYSWWGLWPEGLRRPGDVWPRLPETVRNVRSLFTATFVFFVGALAGFLAVLLVTLRGNTLPLGERGWLLHQFQWLISLSMYGLPAAAVAAMLLGIGLTIPWKKRFKLSAQLLKGLMWEPTWNNAKFWKRPEIAPLLELSRSVAPGTPQSPAEFAEAIARQLAALPAAMRLAAADAPPAARDLVRLVVAIDHELAELSRDADPAERQRLIQKLAAMDAMADASPSRRNVRDLIAGQLALLDRLESRRRELGDDRERHVALLRNLWFQIASLRADGARDALSVTEITGQVRALCDQVARYRDAYAGLAGDAGSNPSRRTSLIR